MFIDESGFMLQPLARRTWALQGCTPELHNWDRHDRYTAIGALVLNPTTGELEFYFALLHHNATHADFLWFIQQLRQELGGELIVVWDRLGAHRKAANIFDQLGCSWVHFEELPSYSPQLNPVEHAWSVSKWSELSNWAPHDKADLKDGVEASLQRQACDETTLQSHFDWAGLDTDPERH